MKYLLYLIVALPLIVSAGEHAGKKAEHAGEKAEHAGEAAEHAGKKGVFHGSYREYKRDINST